jgi:negative regulator of flagellin synthesis FlgM
MVDGVRIIGRGPVERVAPAARAASVDRTQVAPAVQTAPSTIATMAAAGAPVDAVRVAAIRAGIADGSYRVDPDAIAAKMIEDLPPL